MGNTSKIKNGRLLLQGSDIARVFNVSVDQIVVLVQQQIQETLKRLQKAPKAVLLMGGFGQSPYLYGRLHAQIRNQGIEIRVPGHETGWTAVCRGALLRASISHAREGGGTMLGMLGASIESRIMRLSYGIEMIEPFDPRTHDPGDKHYVPSVGEYCALHQMHWYIRANEIIDDHTTIKLDWSKRIKTPLPNSRFTVVLFQCARDYPPLRREEDVRQAAVIECVVDTPFDQLPAYTSADGELWRVVEFQVEVKIQGTMIGFAAYYIGHKQRALQINPPSAAHSVKLPRAETNPRKSPILSPIRDSGRSSPIQNETNHSITSPIESISLRGRDVAYSITSTISSDPSLWSELPSRPTSRATTFDLDSESVDKLILNWRNFQSLGISESPVPQMVGESSRDIGESVRTIETTFFANPDVSPETLQSALARGNLDDVQMLLDEHFDSVAVGDFVWLLELRGHGYTTIEIAQLLITEQNESPWISFEPKRMSTEPAIRDYHQPLCVHTGGRDVRPGAGLTSELASNHLKDNQTSWCSDDETMMYLEELCGLAGVVPSCSDRTEWIGSVRFEGGDECLSASVSFVPSSPDFEVDLERPAEIGNKKALSALESLCNGIGLAQRRGICCDSFTYLYLTSDRADFDLIELCQVQIAGVLNLHSKPRTSRGRTSKPSKSLSFPR